jgi:hypothetical protein
MAGGFWQPREGRTPGGFLVCRRRDMVPPKSKGGHRARGFGKIASSSSVPGRSEAPPGLEGYFLAFFFDLAFFAFFAFFAFLAITSSQGLMDGNATRGMLGGGPASQYPQMQSQQIREALPRTVTSMSSRYPQLLCVFGLFLQNSDTARRPALTMSTPYRQG